jgi:hypothetical protein
MNTNKPFIQFFTINTKIAATPKSHRQIFYFSYTRIIAPVFFLTKKRFSVLYFRFEDSLQPALP